MQPVSRLGPIVTQRLAKAVQPLQLLLALGLEWHETPSGSRSRFADGLGGADDVVLIALREGGTYCDEIGFTSWHMDISLRAR